MKCLLALGLTSGDEVAVALTGSNPGANLAVLAACQTLGIKANTICAVSSTWWGANNPRFTWVDMQSELAKTGLITAVPVAASLGGMDDNATGLSSAGRIELKSAVERNSMALLSGASADQSGRVWWTAFKNALKRQKYAAYINVGEGVASTGHSENGRLLAEGLHRRLPSVNWPARGALHLAAAEGVPVIHFFDPTRIARGHGLGAPKIPLAEPGIGDVFTTTRYDVRVAAVALLAALGTLFALVRIDAKYFRLADAGVDPETLL
ncbi:MAG: poly-gamma-glutamate system protein [bacterium]|nr:poly-gamma-glutamate system protein [bacterium]